MALMEQRQDYMDDKVLKHMVEEMARYKDIKDTQTLIFSKLDTVSSAVTQNTIDYSTGVKSIKMTIVTVGTVLSMIFGIAGIVIAVVKFA